ncbi:hypothetical protein M9H77_06040 [Catharanthus roseus]|uniref:Uncharacterized protein n=1 Tax=Catharanthus roseus TaxID=4058 RepID=A0ACC0BR19_CATRO|nr:hypothetical protein M9H77_06040 [Catharanthus roseus]
MGEEKKAPSGVWPTVKPFVNGGASGMLATCVIQPIDMIKVRIQLGQGSAGTVTRNMLKNEGVGAFYKGLSAGLLRQATYTTARLGSFRILTNKALEANEGKPLPLYQKALCGLTAGAIGACVGSPADLALIRMQADATLPAAQRRNYTNAFHALYRITADEGVLALWKGAGPTVVRAMALNMGMLASYDQSVEFFRDSLGFGEAATVIGASSVSGFFAAACSLPFDYVKTQIQKMQPDAEGKYPYTGSLDCALKTLKSGGPLKFYTGFPVYCVRIAPHVMMTWIFLNQIQKLEKNAVVYDGEEMEGKERRRKPINRWIFANQFAASASIATLAFHPLDTVKVRMQLGQGSGFQVISNMLRNEGIRGFYKANNGKRLSEYQKISCLMTTAAIGSCICNPLDLVLVRMQANAPLPATLCRNYANVPHAFYRVVADEGIRSLWKGAGPTVMRTMASFLGYYVLGSSPRAKGPLKPAEYIAFGILPPTLSKPFDYVKTQLQKMHPDAMGKYPYTGSIDCAIKTLKLGGPLKFYTGFSAYFLTSFPHCLLTVAIYLKLSQQQISFKWLNFDQE